MAKTVLVVEDEKPIVDILTYNLKKEGYEVLSAMDGEAGLALALTRHPDLVLLDVMLPKMDGFEVCKTIRHREPTLPVIMLTAREEEADKVFGLEQGADDYVTKPFSMRELMARVKANIRRSLPVPAPAAGPGLVIDERSMNVTLSGVPVELSKREYELLHFLAGHPGEVFSREELMDRVWNFEYYGDMRTVDVTVRRLREKIEDDPASPTRILTKRGAGYYYACN